MGDTLYDAATPFSPCVDGRRSIIWAARLSGPGALKSPRVLLLHGNPADLDDWRLLGPRLAETCDVVAADLPGFGRSQAVRCARNGSRLEPAANAMIALADALGWSEPFVVVGHSCGAAVAQVLAARHPERIAGIALIASLGWPAHPTYRPLASRPVGFAISALAALLRRGWLIPLFRRLFSSWAQPIFAPTTPAREDLEARQSRFLEEPDRLVSMVEAARGKPSEELMSLSRLIRARVFAVHGAEDSLVPSGNVRSLLAQMISTPAPTTFEIVDGAGHMVHITHAADIGRRIAAWI